MHPPLLGKNLTVSGFTHSENMSLIFLGNTEDDLYYLVFGPDHPDIEVVKTLEKGCVVKLKSGESENTRVVGPQGEILIRIERIKPA